jgi:cytochrome c2
VIAVAVLAVAGAAAGCGAEGTTKALPQTVVGTLPKAQVAPTNIKGDPAAGKALFASQGCGGCHTFPPAGSKGTVGPKLVNIPADASKAGQGTVQQYTYESIAHPNSYVVPGFPSGVMPDFSGLGQKKISDLVAFLLQK